MISSRIIFFVASLCAPNLLPWPLFIDPLWCSKHCGMYIWLVCADVMHCPFSSSTTTIRFECLVACLFRCYLFDICLLGYTCRMESVPLEIKIDCSGTSMLFFFGFCYSIDQFPFLPGCDLSESFIKTLPSDENVSCFTMYFPSWSTYLSWAHTQKCLLRSLTDALILFTCRLNISGTN